MAHLTIRSPGKTERPSIERLAALDDGQLPDGELLIAEVDGELWAAVSLDTGAGVADPFRPSAGVLAALHATARSLRHGRLDGRRDPGRRARLRRRGGRYLRRGRATALKQVHRAPA